MKYAANDNSVPAIRSRLAALTEANTHPQFIRDVAKAASNGFNVVRPSQHGEEPKVMHSFDTREEAQAWIDMLDPQDAAYLYFVEPA